MIRRLFTAHPATVSESYGEHFGTASGFAMKLFLASLACAVHAVLPFLFEKTGSRMINELHDRMVRNRARHITQPVSPEMASAPQRS